MASMTSLVSARGRLFYILDEGPRASIQLPSRWRLIARDAFNGTILWKRDVDRWNTRQYPLKSGPAHLLRRLVAVEDRVYVTLGIDAPVAVLDAATGHSITSYEGSELAREIVVSDGVVFVVADNGPSRLPNWRRVSTYVWDNTRRANPDWGWQGDSRKILAYAAESGKLLWRADVPVAPCSLCVDATRAVFHDGVKLVGLDRHRGTRLWETDPAPTTIPVHTNTGPRVLIYGDVVLLAANDGKVSGWSARDGRKLWEKPHRPSGHQSLKDLLVVNGLAWSGSIAASSGSGVFTGYDPVSGEVKQEFPPDVHVHWFHHRCYPAKGAGHYLLTARNGTEFVDLETERWKPHHWVRGGCIYGVMPCNGMTYASMDACGCQLEAKLSGFKALASGPIPRPGEAGLPATPRLSKGPAYDRVEGPRATSADWPTYRHDEARSGASPVTVGDNLGQAWQAEVGGRLSAPTVAAGKLFVAAVDTHTVCALDATTGEPLWSFTTGGRVDSPPTYYRGLVLFGSADGYVYALNAQDGLLAWRFRGAPVDRRMTAWEQLESAWPVHGSVLVYDGVVYCTAGRNMFLDGGIHFLRLDPRTGKLLGEVVMNDRDPESGEEMHLAHLEKTQGNNMPVALSDVLSCDGRHVWMRSQKIDFEGNRLEIGLEDVNEQPADDCHLFCQVGFLDASYFFRTYWTFGRRVSGGYGGWLKAGRLVPSGRILCFDDTHVYGFGRKPEFMTNSSVLQYQIFSADKTVTREAIERIRKAEAKINARSAKRNANASDWLLRRFFPKEDLSAVSFAWALDNPTVTDRAMALGGDTLFVAGPPNFLDERRAYRLPDDPDVLAKLELQQEALEGRHGGLLWALAKDDGRLLARYSLDTIPVFDGMAAAGGRLYVSTVDGRVLCLGGNAAPGLKRARGLPERIEWDQPEDPSYLLPPKVPKEGT
jgi:outer membrane protein assembly factor BamB